MYVLILCHAAQKCVNVNSGRMWCIYNIRILGTGAKKAKIILKMLILFDFDICLIQTVSFPQSHVQMGDSEREKFRRVVINIL